MGGEVRQVFLTTGHNDVVLIAEEPEGEVMSKFALALGSMGNVRTTTTRAWTEEEFTKIIAELP